VGVVVEPWPVRGPGGCVGSEAKARSGATAGRATDGRFTYQIFSPLHTF
jgi:hypothetical protein